MNTTITLVLVYREVVIRWAGPPRRPIDAHLPASALVGRLKWWTDHPPLADRQELGSYD
jgi:hypothetical protein